MVFAAPIVFPPFAARPYIPFPSGTRHVIQMNLKGRAKWELKRRNQLTQSYRPLDDGRENWSRTFPQTFSFRHFLLWKRDMFTGSQGACSHHLADALTVVCSVEYSCRWPKSKWPADHASVQQVPVVVTDCAPGQGRSGLHLHAAFVHLGAAAQTGSRGLVRDKAQVKNNARFDSNGHCTRTGDPNQNEPN